MASSLVTIDQSDDYELSNVKKAAHRIFSNYPDFIKKIRGSRVLLKPNFLFPDPPEKLTCTHPAVVEAVIGLILEYGGHPALGDRPAKGNARNVARITGILKICEKYGVPIVEFKKYRKIPLLPNSRFSNLGIACELDDFDLIVNLPKLKVHSQLLLTGAVKNLFGCIRLPHRVWAHIRSVDRESFAELLIHVCSIVRPAFSLVDGITAMQKEGPRGGIPYQAGVLLGGTDPLCVDTVAAAILNIKIEDVPILRTAQRLGFLDPDRVKIKGIPRNDVLCPDFSLPPLQPVSFNLYRSGKILVRRFLYAILNRRT